VVATGHAEAMTQNTDSMSNEQPATGASQPPFGQRPLLRRSRNDRVIGGVAAGVARWLMIDPIIVRVVLVVLAIFGGAGLVLYAIGWLLIPEEGNEVNEAQKLIDGGSRFGVPQWLMAGLGILVALIVFAAVLDAGPWHGAWLFGGGGSLLLLIAAGALVLWIVKRDQPIDHMNSTAPATTTDPHQTASEEGFAYGGFGDYPGYTPPSAALPRKPPSYLGSATLSIALVVMGSMTALTMLDVAHISAVVILAAGLGVLGLGLVVGTFVGHARWLIALALPLLLVSALVSVLPTDLRLGTQIGERTWIPSAVSQTASEFRLDIGEARLDLRELSIPAGTTPLPIHVSVGIGELKVIAPAGDNVIVHSTVGVGRIAIAGVPEQQGSNTSIDAVLPGLVDPKAPTIDLVADVSLGNLEVSRA